MDTQLNLFDGGRIRSGFLAGVGRSQNIEVNIFGGTVGHHFRARAGSTINASGGFFNSVITAEPDSQFNISGGIFDHGFHAETGSSVRVFGGDFLLDGQQIPGLAQADDTADVSIRAGTVLTGVLSDGRPFVFTDALDEFSDGTLSVQLTELPSVGPSNLVASEHPETDRLRGGQNLLIDAPLERIQAGIGSSIRIVEGGIADFEAIGTTVDILGGQTVGRAHYGSVINVYDGEIEELTSFDRSTINFYSGTNSGSLRANNSVINIHDGMPGGIEVDNGGEVNIFGGQAYGNATIHENSSLNLNGGALQYMGVGGTLNASGGSLRTCFEIA